MCLLGFLFVSKAMCGTQAKPGQHTHMHSCEAAEDIKACLSQQELDVWLDSRQCAAQAKYDMH